MKLPKVSIILATKDNHEQTKVTVDCILRQKYKNWELLIVDSSIKQLTMKKDRRVVIEHIPARGVANAFNKALEVASGDYVYMIGQGDTFVNDYVIQEMMMGVNVDNEMLIVGQINRVKEDGQILYTTKNVFKKWQLLYKMAIPHQGLFTHRKFFKKFGVFDESCRYAMDYELLLRAYKDFPRVVQKDVVVANWVEGGVGQNDTEKVLEEYHRIRIKNNIAPRLILNLIYWLSKLRYGYR